MMTLLSPPKRQFFTDVENDVLRHALERLIDSYGTQTHAAKLLGVAQGTVSAFLAKKHGATPGVARKIAQLSGTTLEQMLGWAGGGALAADLYANRHVAVQMARMAGCPEVAIAAVQAMRLEDGAIDKDVLWWFDKIRAQSGGGC